MKTGIKLEYYSEYFANPKLDNKIAIWKSNKLEIALFNLTSFQNY